MLTLRGFLERFRPAGTPGAAAPRGVPADRVADRAAELLPLLTLLDEAEAEAEAIRQNAVADAARRRTRAAEEGAAAVAQARVGAEAARAEAAARIRSEAKTATADLTAAGAASVAALRERVAERMPEYVERVVAEAGALVDELAGPTSGQGVEAR